MEANEQIQRQTYAEKKPKTQIDAPDTPELNHVYEIVANIRRSPTSMATADREDVTKQPRNGVTTDVNKPGITVTSMNPQVRMPTKIGRLRTNMQDPTVPTKTNAGLCP